MAQPARGASTLRDAIAESINRRTLGVYETHVERLVTATRTLRARIDDLYQAPLNAIAIDTRSSGVRAWADHVETQIGAWRNALLVHGAAAVPRADLARHRGLESARLELDALQLLKTARAMVDDACTNWLRAHRQIAITAGWVVERAPVDVRAVGADVVAHNVAGLRILSPGVAGGSLELTASFRALEALVREPPRARRPDASVSDVLRARQAQLSALLRSEHDTLLRALAPHTHPRPWHGVYDEARVRPSDEWARACAHADTAPWFDRCATDAARSWHDD